MEQKNISCYLCNAQAKQEEGFDTSRNIRVICRECKTYLLTYETLRFFFMRKDEEAVLNDEDKKKLSDYVREHYDDEEDEPVPIFTNTITAVTGKQSMNISYS